MTVKMFEPIAGQRASESIFPLRAEEPGYARLNDTATQDKNRYGRKIALYDLVDEAASLNINGVSELGFNPNRNQQHAFHFTADNCIGCHACESACSEKNDLAPHLSFRSVGYVEGGSYPNYSRMNISMACNHCDDPVCLKGCPTRAYTKHAEYGAVIQDPDICFGCGYCTWVCPYNAPQLDPVKGRVEKCNMCVDRLEVGLKPACVAACLGNALDFGVVENTPENREQIEARIPGFPDPEITHPNIRFQQTRSLPRELTRPDSAPVKYSRDNASGHYQPAVDRQSGKAKRWNLGRLSSRENPLLAFTLASQSAIGLVLLLPLLDRGLYPMALFLAALFSGCGLLLSATHLGKPLRAYRGFNNLRYSPMAREGFACALFMVFTGIAFLSSLSSQPIAARVMTGVLGLAFGAGLVGLYYMVRCYLIQARPFWNHWQTASSFAGAALYLGAIGAGLLAVLAVGEVPTGITAVLLAGLSLEALGLYYHQRDMASAESEGAVSHYVQCTTFGQTYRLRNLLLGGCVVAAAVYFAVHPQGMPAVIGWVMLALVVVAQCLTGRALFYVLVIPTTMPGAFFWKNKAFEQHAREVGLADMPQVGVAKGH